MLLRLEGCPSQHWPRNVAQARSSSPRFPHCHTRGTACTVKPCLRFARAPLRSLELQCCTSHDHSRRPSRSTWPLVPRHQKTSFEHLDSQSTSTVQTDPLWPS